MPSALTSPTATVDAVEALTLGSDGSTARKFTPVAQEARHSPPLHSWPPPHVALQAPQLAGSVRTSTHAMLQLVMQAVPQTPAVQVGFSLALPPAQTAHAPPQAPVKSAGTHELPQALKPVLQV
jgi:hypothetical protein